MAENAAGAAGSSQPQEDDLSLPRAAVNKMIKEMIPMIRVSNDARELVLNCCTEFIHLIASEANEICNKQTKKTISPEHVISALESLGFHDYVKDVESVYQQFKTQAQTRKKNNKMKNQGVSEEELLRQQQALFAQARAEQAQEDWLHMQQQQQQLQQQLQQQQQQAQVGQQLPGQYTDSGVQQGATSNTNTGVVPDAQQSALSVPNRHSAIVSNPNFITPQSVVQVQANKTLVTPSLQDSSLHSQALNTNLSPSNGISYNLSTQAGALQNKDYEKT